MDLKQIQNAIQVIEWSIDYRKSLLSDSSDLVINELHQLRQGKSYLELIESMLLGTSELLEMDKELVEPIEPS
tara:strand:- start:49 stop:267 length:219 start_codon:yes stop_codon:yes gene_type:complete